MKKTKYNNLTFLLLLKIFLLAMFGLNILTLISGDFISAFRLMLIAVLIYFVFKEHKYAKDGIHYWTLLLIIGSSLALIGKTLKIVTGDPINPYIESIIIHIITLTIAFIVYNFNKNTVELKKVEIKI